MLRVVLSGVESVGKSSLANWLARSFDGVRVPEFGRTYTEQLGRDLLPEDHLAIAEGHVIAAEAAAESNPPVLVEDTDVVMTTAWTTMLFGFHDPILAAIPSRADLHLLLMPDVPFVQDKVRMFGADADRLRFHHIVEEEFRSRGIVPVRISGSFPTRRRKAAAAVREKMAQKATQ